MSHPTDDVISDLLAPKIDGEVLSEHEFNNFFTLLVAAGNDTTRYTMTAGMKALIERPDQLAELRDGIVAGDTDLVTSAVEEILRWSTVTMHFRRTATADTELAGRAIRAGDKVVIWFVSADYDDEVFADPFTFDLRRSPNPQVAFGLMSPHLCLGAQLARMEIKVLFEELLPRLADVRIDGPIDRLRSNFIAGIKRLPVRVSHPPDHILRRRRLICLHPRYSSGREERWSTSGTSDPSLRRPLWLPSSRASVSAVPTLPPAEPAPTSRPRSSSTAQVPATVSAASSAQDRPVRASHIHRPPPGSHRSTRGSPASSSRPSGPTGPTLQM